MISAAELKYMFLIIKDYEPHLGSKIMEYLFTDAEGSTTRLIRNPYRINEVLIYKYIFGIELDENPQLELCKQNFAIYNFRDFYNSTSYKFNKLNFKSALKECIKYHSIYHDKFIKKSRKLRNKYHELYETIKKLNSKQRDINNSSYDLDNMKYRPVSPLFPKNKLNKEGFLREYVEEISSMDYRINIEIEKREEYIERTVMKFIF
jgi:hypothetical protein